MAVSLLLLSLFILVSCANVETSLPVNPPIDNSTVPFDSTPATLLDIKSFQAQPKTIKPGETTTIVWNVTGASAISIEPAIGAVSGNAGSISVTPKETTLYTLKVSDGRIETAAKFLVIVKTVDGSIIWPNSGSDNATTEQMYEGWNYYPNKYIEWVITDRYDDPYGNMGTCGHVGYITNKHPEWTMTEVTVGVGVATPQPEIVTNNVIDQIMKNNMADQNRVVLDFILPGWKSGYTTSMDCKQLPELKWKWKIK